MSRRAILAGAILLLLSLMVVPQALAAGVGVLQGSISNGTEDGGPVAGIEVTLLPFQEGVQKDALTTVVDGSGAFQFAELETGSDWAYMVRASHSDVVCTQGPIVFEGGQTVADAQLTIYEATDDDMGIVVERAHFLLSFAETGLQITEVYVFRNSGDRTFVGTQEIDGRRVATSIELPRGARGLALEDGSLGGRFLATKDGFADTEPQWPGQTSVVFSYEVDCPSRQCTVSREMPAPTLNLNVLLPSVGTLLDTDRLSFGGEMDAQGQSYLNYTGLNLAGGEEVTLRLVPMSGATSSSTRSSGQSPLAVAAIVAAAIAGVGALAYPLLRKRAGEEKGDATE
jgi:hypothetical protein